MTGRVRIIGGRWRRRVLTFPEVAGLRPTPDRVRETLFNWLAPRISGARCLDLFAGSGALGIEAVSRGASGVVLVERERVLVQRLREHVRTLDAQGVQAVHADALAWLGGTAAAAAGAFDVVFLDPPFRYAHLREACARLADGHWLAPGALIYVERGRDSAEVPLPAGWEFLRSGRAGRVRYHLLTSRRAEAGAPGAASTPHGTGNGTRVPT